MSSYVGQPRPDRKDRYKFPVEISIVNPFYGSHQPSGRKEYLTNICQFPTHHRRTKVNTQDLQVFLDSGIGKME